MALVRRSAPAAGGTIKMGPDLLHSLMDTSSNKLAMTPTIAYFNKGAGHDSTRKTDVHRQDTHHRRARWCFAQLGRTDRRQAVVPRHRGWRHRPGATVRRRMVGLLSRAIPTSCGMVG